MSDEDRKLVREEGSVRPRRRKGRSQRTREDDDGRLRRDDGWEGRRRRRDRRGGDDDDEDYRSRRESRRRRGRHGRPPLTDEFSDLGRGSGYVAAEAIAIGMDIASRVLRGAVDNALDEDYTEPGDVVRGLSNEADLAVYDLVDELRRVPRRFDRRFQEGIRSPRADRGERVRRDDD